MIPLLLFLLQASAPRNVVANPEFTSVIYISWADSNPPGSTYTVYRAPGACSGSGTFTQLITKSPFKDYTNASLVASSTYCYYIVATVGSTNSAPSPKAQATTPASDTHTQSVRLNWNHTDTTGLVKFRAMRGDGYCSPDTVLYTVATAITSKTWTDKDVITGATYCYHIVSYTDEGGKSEPSNQTHVVLSTSVTVPVTGLTVTLKGN